MYSNIWVLRDLNYPAKKKKKRSSTAWQGFIEHVPNFRVFLQNTRWLFYYFWTDVRYIFF